MSKAHNNRDHSRHNGKHPGFNAAAKNIADKQGIPESHARAILAASTRGASASAKRANPRLNRVN